MRTMGNFAGIAACWALVAALTPTAPLTAQAPDDTPAPPRGAKRAVADLPAGAEERIVLTDDGVYLSLTYWRPALPPRVPVGDAPAAEAKRPRGRGPSRQTGVVVIANHPQFTQRDWFQLAKQLHEEGHAVVTFDFRGFGGSRNVDANTYQPAKGPGKGASGKKRQVEPKIDSKEFRKAADVVALVNDLDAVKQFLILENNEGVLNVGQLGLVVAGDAGGVTAMHWLAEREFGPRKGWAREQGDVAALVLISPSFTYKGWKAATLPENSKELPVFLAASGETADKFTRQLALPTTQEQRDSPRYRPFSVAEKVAPPRGPAKKTSAAVTLTPELLRTDEFAPLRTKIVNFLRYRLAPTTANAWERREVELNVRVLPGR